MTDFDMIFDRLRGLTWSHVAMAACCFVLGAALFVSPAWVHADFVRLQQLLSWFAIASGALSLIGSFASAAPSSQCGVEPVAGVVLLAGGLWALNFPPAASSFSVSVSALGIFLALYMVLTALEMDRRGAGHWVAQLVGALAVLAVSFAGLFGLAGSAGMLALAALQLYIAGWGFVYASVSLSVHASGVAAV